MTSSPTIENYWIRAEGFNAIDDLLVELGADPHSALAAVGLEPDILMAQNKDQSVDYRLFLNLLNHCAQITRRSDFGNLLSRYQDMTVIGAPGQAMYQALNFREAVGDLVDFFGLHMNGMKVGFEESNVLSMVRLEVIVPFSPNYRQQIELSLGIGLRFVRRLLGDAWHPREAFFEHQKDNGAASTQALFGCPIHYESEFNGFSFESAALDIPREEFDSETRQILYEYLRYQTRLAQRDFAIECREQVIHSLRSGSCNIDAICQGLGLSRRTLQRRLAAQGVHFSELLEETRMDLAQRYLRGSPIPITHISNILGYTDVSSFSRSFKRFFGVSPRMWKQTTLTVP